MKLSGLILSGALLVGGASVVSAKEPTPTPYFLTVYVYPLPITCPSDAACASLPPSVVVLPPFGPYGKKDDCVDAAYSYVTACPASFGAVNCPATGFGATVTCAQGFQTEPQD